MRIESTSLTGIARGVDRAGDVNRQRGTNAAQGVGGDDVTLSARARMLAVARQALADTPAVRQSVVDAARAKLADGTYKADGRSISEALIATVRGTTAGVV